MLNHHLLLPQYAKQHNGSFIHYLSLGAHKAPYELSNIKALSVMTLLDKQRLPELETDKDKWTSLLIPIKGTLRIDGETVEKGKSPLMNPTNISNEGDNVAVFMYMVLKADEKVKQRVSVTTSKEKEDTEQSGCLIYLLEGQLTVGQKESETIMKAKEEVDSTIPLLYCVGKTRVTLQTGSVYLRLTDVQ